MCNLVVCLSNVVTTLILRSCAYPGSSELGIGRVVSGRQWSVDSRNQADRSPFADLNNCFRNNPTKGSKPRFVPKTSPERSSNTGDVTSCGFQPRPGLNRPAPAPNTCCLQKCKKSSSTKASDCALHHRVPPPFPPRHIWRKPKGAQWFFPAGEGTANALNTASKPSKPWLTLPGSPCSLAIQGIHDRTMFVPLCAFDLTGFFCGWVGFKTSHLGSTPMRSRPISNSLPRGSFSPPSIPGLDLHFLQVVPFHRLLSSVQTGHPRNWFKPYLSSSYQNKYRQPSSY